MFGGAFSPVHLILLLVVVIILFGRGKIPHLADDLAKGIKAFRNGLREDEKPVEKQEIPVDKPPVP